MSIARYMESKCGVSSEPGGSANFSYLREKGKAMQTIVPSDDQPEKGTSDLIAKHLFSGPCQTFP